MTLAEQVLIWDAVNKYAFACGGDHRVTPERMDAVIAVNQAVDELLKAMLEAAKQAMWCLTCENETSWRISQSYDESPYNFLYKAIQMSEPVQPSGQPPVPGV
jgi:hypothetical protein